ncbi:NAD-dependent epimerase/dehydratase family protein [Flavobacteriaceae bacterium F89]|uniref:NAD-dependent epimerase/dehydratase family protein n=1 Tax=Cerina litoralis TaxID=2874477 RepID=A0AAE3EZA8_9FLAO|nr:NAD-dependent epimerase/dehydratase family protein [Cerina litoralis]MCG2462381.1 NAD-dependent epimerase/dehydratase family protein [Cerina litoralis]
MDEKILITGAAGQLGTVLTEALIKKYGPQKIVASDINNISEFGCNFEVLDATDMAEINRIVIKYRITQIYHLAAILSAKGEQNPLSTWDINQKSFFNVLECAKDNKLNKVFFPSSIAVYGNSAPKIKTPQSAFLNPSTVYGMSKASGEQWAQYYSSKYGLDVRSLRYPGIIGYQSSPGGGTTDYAIEIYHSAVKEQPFVCYLNEGTRLPMIFIYDAIRATLELMEARKENLVLRSSYNLQGISFAPKEIIESIKKYYPDFNVIYKPDFRQEIAETWPQSMDDTNAREDWGWIPSYSLADITMEMITQIRNIYEAKNAF